MNKLETIYRELEKKYEELDILRRKLDRSFAIMHLWKDAFENGKVYSSFVGNLNKLETLKLKIRNSKEEKEFNILDIPPFLFFHQIEKQREGKTGWDYKIWDSVIRYYNSRREE